MTAYPHLFGGITASANKQSKRSKPNIAASDAKLLISCLLFKTHTEERKTRKILN